MKFGKIIRGNEFRQFSELICNLNCGLFDERRLRLFVEQGARLLKADCMCCWQFHPLARVPGVIFKSECSAQDLKVLISFLSQARRMPEKALKGYPVFTGKDFIKINPGDWQGFFKDLYSCFWDHSAPGHYLFSAIKLDHSLGVIVFKRDFKGNPDFGSEEKKLVNELCPHLENFLRLRYLTNLWHQQGGARSFFRSRGLSEREIEVAVLVLKGRPTNKMRQEMKISEETVRDHLKNIYKKLGIHSKSELVSWFIRLWEEAMKEALGKSRDWSLTDLLARNHS